MTAVETHDRPLDLDLGRSRERSRWWRELHRILTNPILTISALLVMSVVVFAVAPALFATHDPTDQALLNQFEMPSRSHFLGTDEVGRDIFSRIVWGSRVAIIVGIVSVGIGVLVGLPAGLTAGYFGGRVDTLLMRIMDAIIAFPPLLLAMAVIAALGPGIVNAMVAIGIVFVPTYARLARGSTLVTKEMDYVLAARATGASHRRIIARHIIPNSLAPIIVQASLGAGVAVIAEAGLAYLGLGSQPPDPSWGVMLRQSSSFLQQHWWVTVPAGLAIFLLVLALNTIGDYLRDVLDPRLRNV